MQGIYFDHSEAQAVEEFIGCLTLSKSTKSGGPEPFKLLPHGRKMVLNLEGWRRPDGRRLFRKAFFSMGRKQAKTQHVAAMALNALFRSRETQPEIYMAAKDRDQASICFDAARSMIERNEYLSSICQITPSKKEIRCIPNGGIIKALSSEGKGKHGYNPTMVVIDEFHSWGPAEKELYDALTTGSKTRMEPLIVIITTAGTDKESLCGREYEYAKKVLSGEAEDPSYFPLIYEVPQDADFTDESLWPLAMPGLGYLCHLEDFREELAAAKLRPDEQNKFRRLYLNQWTSSESQWVSMKDWESCRSDFTDEDLIGKPCYGGLDLGATRDLTAFCLFFPHINAVRCWGYIPSDGIDERCKRDGVFYNQWTKDGHIRITSGNATDNRAVVAHILELAEKYDIRGIAFDRWGASDTQRSLADAGLNVVQFGQGYASMSPAVKRAEILIYERALRQDGNPALRWCVDCVAVESDHAGNVRLRKPSVGVNSRRIDMAIAMVMAIGVSIIDEGPQESGFTVLEL
jgi:phage terminase large subunit-like protein